MRSRMGTEELGSFLGALRFGDFVPAQSCFDDLKVLQRTLDVAPFMDDLETRLDFDGVSPTDNTRVSLLAYTMEVMGSPKPQLYKVINDFLRSRKPVPV